jgi:HEAT repeat protein
MKTTDKKVISLMIFVKRFTISVIILLALYLSVRLSGLNFKAPATKSIEDTQINPDTLLAHFAGYDDGQPVVVIRNIEKFLRSQTSVGQKNFEIKLIALLGAPATTPAARNVIIGWLRLSGSSLAVPALEKLAAGTDFLNTAATGALADIPDVSAEFALIRLLNSADEANRVTVINALGQRRAVAAIPGLSIAAGSTKIAIANAAIEALVRLPAQEAFKVLNALYTKNPESPERTGSLLKAAGNLLRQPETVVKANIRKDALISVRKVLASQGDALMRIDAAGILLTFDAANEGQHIFTLLKDPDARVAVTVARRLVSVGQPCIITALKSGFSGYSPGVQSALISAVYERAKPDALSLARVAIDSPDPQLRVNAALTLGRCGDEHVVDLLTPFLEEDLMFVNAGSQALGLLPAGPSDDILRSRLQVADKPGVRAALLGIIADRQDHSVWPQAIALCKDTNIVVRFAALNAIIRLIRPGDFADILALKGYFQPTDKYIKWRGALFVTASIENKPDQAVALLLRTLAEPMADSTLLIGVLSSVPGVKAADAVKTLLKSSDPGVRKATILALSAAHTNETYNLLKNISKSAIDTTDRILALRGFLETVNAYKNSTPDRFLLEDYRFAWSAAMRGEEKEALIASVRQLKGKPAQEFLKQIQ